MKTLCVLQHVEADYLGLMEDHFESRNIRFHYCRPFTPGGRVPAQATGFDGLIILGAGPLGMVSGDLVPSLAAELHLAGEFLRLGLAVIGIGLGAAILAVAAGGGAEQAPLRFAVTTARRTASDALAGHLPERLPSAIYMRDRPRLPAAARVLATGEGDEALVFQIGANCRRLSRPSGHQIGDGRRPDHGIRRSPRRHRRNADVAQVGTARDCRRIDPDHGRPDHNDRLDGTVTALYPVGLRQGATIALVTAHTIYARIAMFSLLKTGQVRRNANAGRSVRVEAD